MNYKKIYNNIIENRIINQITDNSIYTEVHHIKPYCLGGTNKSDNLVRLTTREHFICHCLLTKMYSKESNEWYKMNNSIILMKSIIKSKNIRYYNSKIYENIKNIFYKEKQKKDILKITKQINEICNFIDKNDRLPKQKSNNIKEKKLGQAINRLKNKKRNNKNFYKIYENVVIERGYPNLFLKDDVEVKGLKQINVICDFIDKNNRLPKQNANNESEIKLAKTLNQFKQSNVDNSPRLFFNSYQILVTKLGYSDLFIIQSKEYNVITNINKLCDFIDKNNRLPKQTANNESEIKLAWLLSNLKRKKKLGKHFYDSYINTIVNRGYPNLFYKNSTI